MDTIHENRTLLLQNNELRKKLRAVEVERDVALDLLTGKVYDVYEVISQEPPAIKKDPQVMGDLMYPQTYSHRANILWKEGGSEPNKKYKIYIVETEV